jgi:hypothetical protein
LTIHEPYLSIYLKKICLHLFQSIDVFHNLYFQLHPILTWGKSNYDELDVWNLPYIKFHFEERQTAQKFKDIEVCIIEKNVGEAKIREVQQEAFWPLN